MKYNERNSRFLQKFKFVVFLQALMNFLLAIFKATGLELSLADKVHMSNMVIVQIISNSVRYYYYIQSANLGFF